MRQDLWLSSVIGISCCNLNSFSEYSGVHSAGLATLKSTSRLPKCQLPADAKFICTQITYAIPISHSDNTFAEMIKLDSDSLSDDQLKYWSTLFLTDRFSIDKRLPAEFSSKIKYRWISDALAHSSSKHVIGYQIKNGVFAGFVVFTKETSFVNIELIAVGEDFRGQGIAGRMISYLSESFGKAIKVGTQEENSASNQLYIKMGGKVVSKKYVYHRYSKRGEA